jgi:cell cycle sensor histidine kinase DivJ
MTHRVISAWIGAVAALGVAAVATGAPAQAVALGEALALGPAFATLLCWRDRGRAGVRATIIGLWIGCAAAAAALTGGASSPLMAGLFVGPALAMRLFGPAAARDASALAIGAAAAAGLAGRLHPGFEPVAPLGFVAVFIGFSAWLVFVSPTARRAFALDRAPDAPVVAAAVSPEAVERRVAELAHEMRTPLNHILGFADLMRQEVFGPLPEKYREYTGLIAASGGRMLSLVNDWLDLGRLAAGRHDVIREAVDLRALAEEAVRDALAASPDRSIEVGGRAAPVMAYVDPRACRQIFDNLLANAVKFTPPDAPIRVGARLEKSHAILWVEDEGPGVRDVDKARLAQPYQRGEGVLAVEGTGLGLSLVRALAAVHGGGLEIADNVPKGAIFRAILADASPPA